MKIHIANLPEGSEVVRTVLERSFHHATEILDVAKYDDVVYCDLVLGDVENAGSVYNDKKVFVINGRNVLAYHMTLSVDRPVCPRCGGSHSHEGDDPEFVARPMRDLIKVLCHETIHVCQLRSGILTNVTWKGERHPPLYNLISRVNNRALPWERVAHKRDKEIAKEVILRLAAEGIEVE